MRPALQQAFIRAVITCVAMVGGQRSMRARATNQPQSSRSRRRRRCAHWADRCKPWLRSRRIKLLDHRQTKGTC
jgi:hypothetical protein